jgi:hypothetical protein
MRSTYQHPNPTATSDESAPHKDDIFFSYTQQKTTWAIFQRVQRLKKRNPKLRA